LQDASSVQDPRGFVAKLSDFGLSKHMRRGETAVNVMHGSKEYMPLEARQLRSVTKASDVYAFGIILWELWHSDYWAPHFRAMQRRLEAQVAAGWGRPSAGSHAKMIAPVCAPQCPAEYASLVSDCLHRDPKRRPKIGAATKRLELFIDRRLFPERPPQAEGQTGSSPFNTKGSTGPATTFGI